MSYWRINPKPHVEEAVRQIAAREGRSLSNALHKLLDEAIVARGKRHQQFEEIKELAAKAKEASLADIIRGGQKEPRP